MFDRRHRPHWSFHLREWVWPRAGWFRVGRYLAHRLARMNDRPENIAAGVACGIAVSFTPFIGLHFILAAVLAWALGGNLLASALGTVVGNPWTFPFIWMVMYRIGAVFVGDPNLVLNEITWDFLTANLQDVLAPMLIGAIPLSISAWFIAYLPLRRLIAAYQHRRRSAINRRCCRSASKES